MSKNTRERQLLQQIRQLQKELDDAYEGVRQLSRALDGIVAQVVVQCGRKTDRGFEVRITPVALAEVEYTVETRQEESDYIICALPKSDRKGERDIGQDLQSKN